MPAEVVLLDYGAGNVRSLAAALRRAGAEPVVSDDPTVVREAQRLMVPGQGSAATAMAGLAERGLDAAIRDAVAAGTRLLGVCVGLQLLFERSAEGDTPCFGFLPGTVEHLDGVRPLPHMGWNDVEPVASGHPLAEGFPGCAYFAHSYAVRDAGEATVATTEVDGQRFASVVCLGSVAGAQFHPERSAAAGAAMLRDFLRWSHAA